MSDLTRTHGNGFLSEYSPPTYEEEGDGVVRGDELEALLQVVPPLEVVPHQVRGSRVVDLELGGRTAAGQLQRAKGGGAHEVEAS